MAYSFNHYLTVMTF